MSSLGPVAARRGRFDADVIIVGAGPVGLLAAMDLDARGISVIAVEQRPFLQPPSVKCNHVAARTMEAFRRLGVVAQVRAAGLPADYPHDVAFRTTLTGKEMTRIPIPAAGERYTSATGPDTAWATPEPPHRINQTFLEPLLVRHVAGLPHVTLLNTTRYENFEQDDDGVSVTVTGLDGTGLDGTGRRVLRAAFLIGADGGHSAVRGQIGATLRGDAVIQHVQSTCIRAPGLYDLMPGRRAWGYYAYNGRRNGHVYAIDGHETFLVHNHLAPGEAASGSVDRDWCVRAILGVGDGFEYEVVSEEDWVARRLVADRFRDGRVFIAGDAAHLWVPYGGYGMNAGIADALNLTWTLGAMLGGWAGPSMIDVYEAERLPITAQVSKFAMSHAERIIRNRHAVPRNIDDDTEEGEEARAAFGRQAYDLNVQQFAAAGLNFGYSYDSSPIISYDGEPAPEYTMGGYTPATAPGCRAPHLWLGPGASLYDRLGHGYTLLRLDESVDTEPLTAAAVAAGVPLEVIDVPAAAAPAEYKHALVICREDQHVAWRGNAAPTDCGALIDLLRGAATGRRLVSLLTLRPEEVHAPLARHAALVPWPAVCVEGIDLQPAEVGGVAGCPDDRGDPGVREVRFENGVRHAVRLAAARLLLAVIKLWPRGCPAAPLPRWLATVPPAASDQACRYMRTFHNLHKLRLTRKFRTARKLCTRRKFGSRGASFIYV